jgi:hypothetical protein
MHLAAHETGVSFEQVTTGLVRFERSVFAAQAATSKQAQMLARMRFSTDQVKGAMQNLDPFLDLFVGKFAHLHEGPEKVGVAMEFMGRAGANNIKFMQQWAARAAEFRQETRALGMELDGPAVAAAREFQTATKKLEAQWESFTLRIGQAVLPALEKMEISFAGVANIAKEIFAGHFYGWADAWVKGANEMAESLERMDKGALATNVLKSLNDKTGKVKEAAEDIHTLSDRLVLVRKPPGSNPPVPPTHRSAAACFQTDGGSDPPPIALLQVLEACKRSVAVAVPRDSCRDLPLFRVESV